MGLPDGYELRAPVPEELEAVAQVIIANDLEDAGQAVLDAGFLREEWSRPGFELATDAWVVVDRGGVTVAYGQVTREQPATVDSWGVVHPWHRDRDIGSSLLDRIEARASELLAGVQNPRFRHAIDAGDRGAGAMLRARGLRPVRHFWHMQIDLDGHVDPGPAPAGIDIGAVKAPIDLPAIHAVMEESFADHWEHHSEPFDRWAAERTGSPSYDPTLWLLAKERGRSVGALIASVLEGRGWVDDLGVLRSHRGRGIGGALLRRSFAGFADRGIGRVLLNVDAESPTGATAVYEREGMRVVKRWDLWER